MYKRYFITLLLCVFFSIYHHAQSVLPLITNNRYFSASNYCLYPDSIRHTMTPPPAGKHPFYISHYGRHGSRYLSNRKGYDLPYHILCQADSMDELTPIGKDVLKYVRAIIQDAEGRWGDLTDIGQRQQQNIARRMVEHFPEVFQGDAFVEAHSTNVNRCVLSMASAMVQLASMNPQLRISMNSSKREMYYLNHQDLFLRDSMMTYRATKAFEAFCAPRNANRQLMEYLFVDSAYVQREVNETDLSYYLLLTALIQQNTPMSAYSSRLLDLFTAQDIHRFWQRENAWWYINYGPSPLNGGHQPYTQRYLLRRIIEDADSILRQDIHGATLRYGHETVILPLVCLLGLNGYDYQTADLESLEQQGWWSCLVFPMASNLQFVFYRSGVDDHDVVFKVLLNEKEAVLPIPSDIAPYYHWEDFRAFYLRKLERYNALRLSVECDSVQPHLLYHGQQSIRASW